MSGSPSEAEVQAQWTAAVDILEVFRVHADGTQAAAAGKFDVLEQLLEGEYTPAGVANAIAAYRSGLSDLISPATVRTFLDPIIREYGKVIDTDGGGDTFGGGYATIDQILVAMYEFFVAQGTDTTVASREIVYGSPSAGGSNIGNGALSRLSVDENSYGLEATHVEKKHFRCRLDQNSGAQEEAEEWEFLGSRASQDSLLKGSTGSGTLFARTIKSRNAGGGGGEDGGSGSLLSNGSFSTFTTTTEEKFTGWEQSYSVMTASGVTSSATVYRSFPGEPTALSCELTVTGGSTNRITMKQTLANMNASQLRSDRPYFLRCMVKDGAVAAAGGNFIMRLGSQSTTLAAGDVTGSWQEVIIALNANCWFANFNEDPFDVEIEWTGGTGGSILIDDMIFCEMDLIDGTYWNLRMNNASPTPWLVDDVFSATESGGTIPTGKLQYYLFMAYGRYMPSTTGTPVITEP